MSTMTFLSEDARITVPSYYVRPMSLNQFRNFAGSKELPEKCTVYYHRGVWGVDVSREQIFTHSEVKTEFAAVLRSLAKQQELGKYFANGVLLVNKEAKLSCNPDGLFATYETMRKKLRAKQGAETGYTELQGTPDMVLEVVSTSSVKKDTELLMHGYWEAGIPEYWLVDARSDVPNFRILKCGPKGYLETRKVDGWMKSNVFEASFKLNHSLDRNGYPLFTLEIKP
jgi:Uma2 family endonuclease